MVWYTIKTYCTDYIVLVSSKNNRVEYILNKLANLYTTTMFKARMALLPTHPPSKCTVLMSKHQNMNNDSVVQFLRVVHSGIFKQSNHNANLFWLENKTACFGIPEIVNLLKPHKKV